MKVLLVDDEADVISLYRAIFELAFPEATIDEANDGREALQACYKTIPYSMIITDFNMPHVDGIGFIKALRSSASCNKLTPVILISGSLPNNDRLLDFPGVHRMHKPFRIGELVEACSCLLRISASFEFS